MKGIILLNGEPYKKPIDCDSAYVLCADGAYNWAKGRVRIDENLGDFDSAKEIPIPFPKEICPSQKDMTDGEIALDKMLSLVKCGKVDSVEIYGGGGAREDHFLGNLHLLYRACTEGVMCKMYTNYAVLAMYSGKFFLKNIRNKTVSLLPFGGSAHIIYSRGLFYPTDDLTLVYGSGRGISNVGTDENAEIDCDSGVLLAVINEEKDVKNHLFEAAEAGTADPAPF